MTSKNGTFRRPRNTYVFAVLRRSSGEETLRDGRRCRRLNIEGRRIAANNGTFTLRQKAPFFANLDQKRRSPLVFRHVELVSSAFDTEFLKEHGVARHTPICCSITPGSRESALWAVRLRL
jgi:hypothetical protein